MSSAPPWYVSRPLLLALIVLAVLAFVALTTGPSFYRTYVSDHAEVTFEVRAEFEVHGQVYSGDAVWNGQLSIAKIPTTSAQDPFVRGEALALRGGPDPLIMLRRAEGKWSHRGYGLFPLLCAPPNQRTASLNGCDPSLRARATCKATTISLRPNWCVSQTSLIPPA